MTGSLPFAVGLDVVSIDRIADALTQRVVKRVFTAAEVAYCRSRADPPQHFAARWAAKEAAIKALPDGLSVYPRDVAVVREEGKPALSISVEASVMQRSFAPDPSTSVSLTHDRHEKVAAAVVVIADDDRTARACTDSFDLTAALNNPRRNR